MATDSATMPDRHTFQAMPLWRDDAAVEVAAVVADAPGPWRSGSVMADSVVR
jgi:hypothetical protein